MVTGKRGRKPKYLHTIVLDGINARDVFKKYKQPKKEDTQAYIAPIIEYSTKNGDSTTQVTELNTKRVPVQVYMDTIKDGRSVTMIDYINYGCLPERTDLWCGHCHHPFNTSPIGMPIKYVNKHPDKNQPDEDKVVGTNDYFLTYGVFCSFPCCLAFLKEHKSALFRNSKSLLYSLYYKLYGTELKARKAPSWECLKVYGGKLSIEDFRKSYCNCNYIITENIKRPYMVAVGKYIEEKRCGYF